LVYQGIGHTTAVAYLGKEGGIFVPPSLPENIQSNFGNAKIKKIEEKCRLSLTEEVKMHRVNKKFMFWNDWMFESVRGLKRTINKPLKSSYNPIFDEPISTPGIIYEGENKIFKMWYSTLKAPLLDGRAFGLAYATSSDGFGWKKPSLRIVKYQGSRENNLTNMMSRGGGAHVYLDEKEPNPERKYKMVYLTLLQEESVEKTALAVSKDGFHWRRGEYPIILPFISDCFNVILYDSFIQKYLVFSRPGYGDRRVAVSLSQDLKSWDGPYTVLEPEEIQAHFYYLLPWQYEGIYVGFLPVLKTEEREIKEEHLSDTGKNDGLVYAELCYSPNGICWQRIGKGQAWIPYGEPGEFDAGGVYPTAAIIVDNEIRIYYEGIFHQHGEVRQDREDCRLGVATLRRDGFISLDAGNEESSVTTRAISSWTHAEDRLKRIGWVQWIDSKKGELKANVETDKGGYLKAELLDEHWNVIEGYSRRESIPVSGNHFDAILQWKHRAKIKPLGKLFRVRLILKNAKLYSFTFS